MSAPLAIDDPAHVRGLAVEVAPGHPLTEYLIGTELRIDDSLIASVPVEVEAHNDVARYAR